MVAGVRVLGGYQYKLRKRFGKGVDAKLAAMTFAHKLRAKGSNARVLPESKTWHHIGWTFWNVWERV